MMMTPHSILPHNVLATLPRNATYSNYGVIFRIRYTNTLNSTVTTTTRALLRTASQHTTPTTSRAVVIRNWLEISFIGTTLCARPVFQIHPCTLKTTTTLALMAVTGEGPCVVVRCMCAWVPLFLSCSRRCGGVSVADGRRAVECLKSLGFHHHIERHLKKACSQVITPSNHHWTEHPTVAERALMLFHLRQCVGD